MIKKGNETRRKGKKKEKEMKRKNVKKALRSEIKERLR